MILSTLHSNFDLFYRGILTLSIVYEQLAQLSVYSGNLKEANKYYESVLSFLLARVILGIMQEVLLAN